MPKLRNLANRTKELDIFLKMAAGDHDRRIMFIEGVSGMGKTSLLSRFKHKCPSEVKFVPFNCKGVNSIAAFLSEVVVDLGHENFPRFLEKVKFFVQGGVDFSENDIAAEKISIAINSNTDLTTQDYRLEQLQQAFFDDLALLEYRIVISLDTYQDANDSLQAWIETKWLRTVDRRVKNVVTVIAGQSVPDPNNLVWGDNCEHFLLTPIIDIQAWCEFCSDLPEAAIKAAAISCKGHPKDTHQTLSLLIEHW